VRQATTLERCQITTSCITSKERREGGVYFPLPVDNINKSSGVILYKYITTIDGKSCVPFLGAQHETQSSTQRSLLQISTSIAALALSAHSALDLDSDAAAGSTLVGALTLAQIHLVRTHDLVVLVVDELVPVRDPAGGTGDGEQHGEVVGGETHSLVDETRVEIDVRIQLALDEVGVTESNLLEGDSDLNEGLSAEDAEHVLSNGADDLGAGVVVLVDAMTEAHETAGLVLDALNELRDVVDGADLLEHAHNSLVGTTVQGTIQRGDRATDAAVDINTGGREVAHSSGGAVELVVSVENEEDVEGARKSGVGQEGLVGELVEHEEEVLGVVEALGRINERTADAVTVCVGGNGGHGADGAVDLLVTQMEVLVDVLTSKAGVRFGMEGGEGGHSGHDHTHGMGVVAERTHHLLEFFVDVGVAHDTGGEVFKLLHRRELTIDKQESNFKEVRFLSELLDRVASVAKNTLITINIGDSGASRYGVQVTRVEATKTRTRVLNREEIIAVDGVAGDGDNILLTATVINDS